MRGGPHTTYQLSDEDVKVNNLYFETTKLIENIVLEVFEAWFSPDDILILCAG